MTILYGGFDNVQFPKMVRIRQELKSERIEDKAAKVKEELNKEEIRKQFRPGQKIAVTVGSRGIDSIAEVVKAVIEELQSFGTEPFIVPAMGSHGGATSEGQLEVLEGYGITEKTMGVPIKATMEVEQLGNTVSGAPVYVSKPACEADGIVVVARVKNHTDFRGPVESGLLKMLTIGLGKHKGATYVHKRGAVNFHRIIPEVGKTIVERAPVLCGLALVENGYDELMIIRAVTPDKFEETDMELLKVAHDAMPKIPFDEIDVLIIEWIGKDISGCGMDPNVTGRFGSSFMQALNLKPKVECIAVLGLTEESHGNAIGIAGADVTTKHFVSQIDTKKVYANAITAGAIRGGAIPMTLDNDLQAIAVALKASEGTREHDSLKVVRIKSTAELDEMEISVSMLPEAEKLSTVEIISEPKLMSFDENGKLI